MRNMRALALILALAAAACDTTPTAPGQSIQGTLSLTVTGGVAGADLAFHVTQDGAVVGDRCTSLCSFEAGDTIRVLSETERADLGDLVVASGIAGLDADVEYPGACCDYFVYELTFSSADVTRTVKGPDATMPPEMADLVQTVAALHLTL